MFGFHRRASQRDRRLLFRNHRGQPFGMQNRAGSTTGLTLSEPYMALQTRLGAQGPLSNRVAAIRRLLNNRVPPYCQNSVHRALNSPCR